MENVLDVEKVSDCTVEGRNLENILLFDGVNELDVNLGKEVVGSCLSRKIIVKIVQENLLIEGVSIQASVVLV